MQNYDTYLQNSAESSEKPAASGKNRKGFPVFGIPAILMLVLMLVVFALEILISTRNGNPEDPFGAAVGTRNYSMVITNDGLPIALKDTLIFRLLQLAVSACLATGIYSLYYAMKKPGTVLMSGCLWLIPACLPYLPLTLAFWRGISPTGQYLLASVLQTTSLFCFFGGLFAFINMKKKGRAGGGPFLGLLIAVLASLTGGLTARAVSIGMVNGRDMTMDSFIARYTLSMSRVGMGSAIAVIKVILQVLIAIVPMIALCILARKKSTRGEIPKTVLWIFLAIPAGVLLSFLSGSLLPSSGASWDRAFFNSVVTVLMAGAFGGLAAYSFIHLMRRVSAFLYGLFAVILFTAMSCLSAQYYIIRNIGIMNTFWPQVFLSVFDERILLFIPVMAFVLRDNTELRPGSLALGTALLAGAAAWGDINIPYIYNTRTATITLPMMAYREFQMSLTVSPAGYLLMILPALALGAGAALLIRNAFREPEAFREDYGGIYAAQEQGTEEEPAGGEA